MTSVVRAVIDEGRISTRLPAANFTEPWLGGKKPNSLTVAGFVSILSNGYNRNSDLYGKLTNGGVHYAFECIGLKTTAEQSFSCLRPGGAATIIGMIPVGTKIELHGVDFLAERKIQGSMMGSNQFRTDMPRLIDFHMQGKLHLKEMVSSRIKLEQINEGFATLKTGGVARNVIMFDH